MRILLLTVVSLWIAACATTMPDRGEEVLQKSAAESDTTALGEAQNYTSKSKIPQVYEREVGFAPTAQADLYKSEGGVISSSDVSAQFAKAEKAKSEMNSVSSSKTSYYTLQFEVVSDVDVAQKRRWAVTQKTGLGAYLLFDSPFYKIRAGKWDNKNEAEDAALQFNAMGISAILIEL